MEQHPDLWTALRQRGIDADDPDIRAAVRGVLQVIDDIGARTDHYRARRCAEAIQAAVSYQLEHPATGDMSSFEGEFDDGDR